LLWLHEPSEIKGIIKRREYLKDRINELAMNSKSKNIRDLYRRINELKEGYQNRKNVVKDENGDLLADSHNILNRWNNSISQLLSVPNAGDFTQIEVYTAEPGPIRLEAEISISESVNKSQGSDQIPTTDSSRR
jgi:hypothetical protein